MLSRKEQNVEGIPLPKPWIEEILDLINSVYEKNCNLLNKKFEIIGYTYPDELLLIVSLVKKDDVNDIPITYMASLDLDNNNEPKKLLNSLVDSIGILFDSVFSNKDWNEYHSNWLEGTIKEQKIFYRISRENIALTLQADELLKNP